MQMLALERVWLVGSPACILILGLALVPVVFPNAHDSLPRYSVVFVSISAYTVHTDAICAVEDLGCIFNLSAALTLPILSLRLS